MEGMPKNEAVIKSPEEIAGGVESIESRIEEAKKLREQLDQFNDKDIVGRDELNKVEEIACALGEILQGISADVCVREGLPYHPMDVKDTVEKPFPAVPPEDYPRREHVHFEPTDKTIGFKK